MKFISEKVKELEFEISKTEELISPLLDLEKKVSEQIRGADQTQAYTNTRPKTVIKVCARNSSGAEFTIPSDVAIRYIQAEIKERTICVTEAKNKIKDIKEILGE